MHNQYLHFCLKQHFCIDQWQYFVLLEWCFRIFSRREHRFTLNSWNQSIHLIRLIHKQYHWPSFTSKNSFIYLHLMPNLPKTFQVLFWWSKHWKINNTLSEGKLLVPINWILWISECFFQFFIFYFYFPINNRLS